MYVMMFFIAALTLEYSRSHFNNSKVYIKTEVVREFVLKQSGWYLVVIAM